jgi:hypothetical protein
MKGLQYFLAKQCVRVPGTWPNLKRVQDWKAYFPIQELTEDIELNKLQKSTNLKRSGREQASLFGQILFDGTNPWFPVKIFP